MRQLVLGPRFVASAFMPAEWWTEARAAFDQVMRRALVMKSRSVGFTKNLTEAFEETIAADRQGQDILAAQISECSSS